MYIINVVNCMGDRFVFGLLEKPTTYLSCRAEYVIDVTNGKVLKDWTDEHLAITSSQDEKLFEGGLIVADEQWLHDNYLTSRILNKAEAEQYHKWMKELVTVSAFDSAGKSVYFYTNDHCITERCRIAFPRGWVPCSVRIPFKRANGEHVETLAEYESVFHKDDRYLSSFEKSKPT